MVAVLCTGANGFIGSHLVNDLKDDHEVVSLVHNCVRGEWQSKALEGTVKVREDIRDFKSLRR
ncbi:MAG: NAD-dependent epimerase/dehydratase family protein, partial [Candidatus Bathyarchaeia archaeon]